MLINSLARESEDVGNPPGKMLLRCFVGTCIKTRHEIAE